MAIQENERKLAELIVYVSEKCASDHKFGAVKLNKILYLSDFLAYGEFGKPITGAEYQKLANGPAPRRLVPVRDELVLDRSLAIQQILLWSGKIMKKTINLRLPDLMMFTGQEIALVDKVIAMLAEDDAQAVSDRTHKMAGWNVVGMNETIPYQTILISCEPLSDAEICRGQEIAKRLESVPA